MAPAVNGEGGNQRSQPITHGRAVNIHKIPPNPGAGKLIRPASAGKALMRIC